MMQMDATTHCLLGAPLLRAHISCTYFAGPDALTKERVQRSSAPACVLLGWITESLALVDEREAEDVTKSSASANEEILAAEKAAECAAREQDDAAKEEAVREAAAKEEAARTEAAREAAAKEAEAAQAAREEAARKAAAGKEAAEAARRAAAAREASAARLRTAQAERGTLTPQPRIPARREEAASPQHADEPPLGIPPITKIQTKGALLQLLPKCKVSEPQRSLMQALTGGGTSELDEAGPCDKCDGPHPARRCPHYPNAREEHKDAWDGYGNKSSTSAGEVKVMLHNATVVTQPGDGSCMFHSLAHGMGSTTAGALRKDIAEYVAANPEVAIGGTPIKDWVLWDSGLSVKDYAARMVTGSHW
eukprot:CAMPEP_0114315332 /NCGR_PEP_ID=MMETSP0059-20121206/22423_1 /TAXON_ID=36894 /ORGANISM="Pyramimonas parkeae, Strain CCMP726" /LENGTH=364 /DNA_ID=CAMNT_0001440809 /DNA_START=325 /DNA_END=1416 /DNA_ORIENTATION=-